MTLTIVDTGRAIRAVPELGERIRNVGHRLIEPPDPLTTEDEVLQWTEAADAVIAGGREPFNAHVLQAARRLRVISRAGVGFDRIDVPRATALGISVAVTPGTLEESVADMALLLLLAAARQVVPMNAGVHGGRWDRMAGLELYGKCLGILGLGRIGRAVSRRAQSFGMRIVAYDPNPDSAWAADNHIRLVDDWPKVLAEADVVSLHLPLTPGLVGFVNRDFLRRMRPGSILVNTARGPLVDEDALAEALTTGHLRAAALDVLATEPVTAHNPLRDLPNVILTPHVASFTVEAWRRVVTRAVDNALAVLADRLPDALVDPAVWERRRGGA